MTTMKLLPFLAVFVFLACKASATVRYVDLNCTNATSPYTSWATAATNIQDAVSIAASGDLILVTNGIYQTGSYSSSGLNRVAVLNAMTVQSVNGPAATVIKGGSNNVFSVVRCVYLVSGGCVVRFYPHQRRDVR